MYNGSKCPGACRLSARGGYYPAPRTACLAVAGSPGEAAHGEHRPQPAGTNQRTAGRDCYFPHLTPPLITVQNILIYYTFFVKKVNRHVVG